MKVNELMTRDVCVCAPEETIGDCAAAMARNDIGALPVAENNLLIGMVTDRDIALRAVAEGKGPETPVREVLTREVEYCYEDQDVAQVASGMASAKLRRVPVLTRAKRLVGMLSLADLARAAGGSAAGAMAGVSEQGGPHSQSFPRR